jgi:hypothetical protein
MLIKPMPSPSGSNREKLYILQGGKGALNRRGLAYDSSGPTPTNRRGLACDTAEPDTVDQIVAWAKENLTPKALHDLSVALLAASYRAGFPTPGSLADAEDEEPIVDPMQTRGKAPGAHVGMDGAAMGLLARFPDLARLGPVEPARRRVPSVSAAAAKSLNDRFGLDRIKSA